MRDVNRRTEIIIMIRKSTQVRQMTESGGFSDYSLVLNLEIFQ